MTLHGRLLVLSAFFRRGNWGTEKVEIHSLYIMELGILAPDLMLYHYIILLCLVYWKSLPIFFTKLANWILINCVNHSATSSISSPNIYPICIYTTSCITQIWREDQELFLNWCWWHSKTHHMNTFCN